MKKSNFFWAIIINLITLFFLYLITRPDPKGLGLWTFLMVFGIVSFLGTFFISVIKNFQGNDFIWFLFNTANGINLYLFGGAIIPLLQSQVNINILHIPVILGAGLFIVFLFQLPRRLKESS